MKKETLNTFKDGLIMDLNPLNTPKTVLTNNLNGTLITYDGNEFVLQNDMGNTSITNLPSGYVPVGIKEHGGIIYIAAHNPKTGESQIGSFPSPKQIYDTVNEQVQGLTFDFNSFYTFSNVYVDDVFGDMINSPFVKNYNTYQQILFQKENSDEHRTFYPGDQFCIYGKLPLDFINAINNNVLTISLGVINTENNKIEILQNLNTYTHTENSNSAKSWIYPTTNADDIIWDSSSSNYDPSKIQTFTGKSSGKLVIIISLNIISKFEVYKKYIIGSDNELENVTLIGNVEGNYNGSTENNSDIVLYESTDNVILSDGQCIVPNTGNIISKKISPVTPYGILKNLFEKQINIDFSLIRQNLNSITEWRFYISDSYIKLAWGYEYYDINNSDPISYIQFKFYQFDQIESDTPKRIINISKDYYNGSFEEIINFENGIEKNNIYVVTINKVTNTSSSLIGYKLLYTNKYFNNKYTSVQNFDVLSRDLIPVTLSLDLNDKTPIDNVYSEKTLQSGLSSINENFNSSYLINEVTSSSDVSNYRYKSKISKQYRYNSQLKFNNKYSESDTIIGSISNDTLNSLFDNGSVNITSEDTINYSGSGNSILQSEINDLETSIDNNNTIGNQLDITVSTNRFITAFSGSKQIKDINIETLRPVYDTEDNQINSKLFAFTETDDLLYCVSGDEDYLCYNTKVTPYITNTTGSVNDNGKGTQLGDGDRDDPALQNAIKAMNMSAPIAIMTGHDGENGKYGVAGSISGSTDWPTSPQFSESGELYGGIRTGILHFTYGDSLGNDFLIMAMKDKNNYYKLVNIATRKVAPLILEDSNTGTNVNKKLLRLDKLLRMIFSQLLMVQRYIKNITFVAASNTNYVYQNNNSKSKINVEYSHNTGGTLESEFYLNNVNISNTLESNWPLVSNFLPKPVINLSNIEKFSIQIGDDLNLESTNADILGAYNNAYDYYNQLSSYSYSLPSGIDRGTVYIGRVGSSYSDYKNAYNSDNYTYSLLKDASGNYLTQSLTGTQNIILHHLSINLINRVNQMFTNTYAINSKTGELGSDFYNEIRAVYMDTATNGESSGKWKKEGGKNAPNMVRHIALGGASPYKTYRLADGTFV